MVICFVLFNCILREKIKIYCNYERQPNDFPGRTTQNFAISIELNASRAVYISFYLYGSINSDSENIYLFKNNLTIL